MTLLETIRTIEAVASVQPSVNMIVRNDVFRLNNRADARYGVFAYVQGQHSASVDSSVILYTFTFFYVDRLLNDRSNQTEIHSVGIQTIDNIVRQLDAIGVFAEQQYQFQVFNQRFVDECAGVFANVTLSVPVASVCPVGYKDMSDDIIIY